MSRTVFFMLLWAGSVGTVFAEGWDVRVGPVVRMGMDVKVQGGSHADTEAMSYLPGSSGTAAHRFEPEARPDPSSVPPDPDDMDIGNRTFDDGYNNISDPTQGAPFQGMTWYWGYRNLDQYDADAHTLDLHRQQTYSRSGLLSDYAYASRRSRTTQLLRQESMDESDDFHAPGAELSASRTLWGNGRFDVDLSVGLSGLWGEEATVSSSTYELQVTQRSWTEVTRNDYDYTLSSTYQETYTFADPFNVIPLVPPPFEGTEEDVGPLIANAPSARDSEYAGGQLSTRPAGRLLAQENVSVRRWSLFNVVDVKSEVDQYALWVGPKMNWQALERLSLFVLPKLSLNLVTADLTRNEDLMVMGDDGSSYVAASWNDSSNDTKAAPGAGLRLGLEVVLGRGWFLTAAGGYEWVDSIDWTVGPSEVEVDLSALEITAGIGMNF
ncbi:MAG TPA: hypothetical protein DCZ95_09160 [Verrucomicrobia bacterium]|nr:MAG: hypothetical protein A2X46_00980 [Lentisphaerae bacterium GWF2_57_35]HBA84246.1 hypothetical protein [Verrucomicrobiota bacterium]